MLTKRDLRNWYTGLREERALKKRLGKRILDRPIDDFSEIRITLLGLSGNIDIYLDFEPGDDTEPVIGKKHTILNDHLVEKFAPALNSYFEGRRRIYRAKKGEYDTYHIDLMKGNIQEINGEEIREEPHTTATLEFELGHHLEHKPHS